MTELRHREMVDRLKINFHDGDHLFVYGPPRCGKTMLLNGLAEELSPHVLLLDMDKSADRLLFDNDLDDLFVRMAENNYSEEQQYFLLIDNSQYFAGLIPLCEKLTSNIQCIFCSDNREDAFDGENVLLNNVRIFRLGTLNFREYLHFYDKDELVVYLPDEALALQELPKQSVMDELEEMYKKFLIYGGFPETVGLKEDKIVSSYFPEMVLPRLQKNLPESYGIRKKKAFYTFIIYLAQIQGHVFNESGAARDLGHRFETLETWKTILLNSGLISRVRPWSHHDNPNEIKRYDKFYLCDTGLKNALLQNFMPYSMRFDIENLIRQTFAEKFSSDPQWQCFYWQSKQGQSLDFIIRNEFDILPVEIKLNSNKGTYIRRYKKRETFDKGCIISMNRFQREDDILTLPAWIF